MRKPISIGVVGTGFGRQVLVPAFRLDARCIIAGICASRFDRARETAETLAIPRSYQDSVEMIADPGIDAVAIAAPPAVQAVVALEAARAGKHLFCEKPLALDAGQAEQILAAAGASGVAHAMDFEFPEVDAWKKTRQILQAGRLGKIRHAALAWRLETYAYRAGTESWKTQAGPGGGTLNNFVSHVFYNLEWLFDPIHRLAARLSHQEGRADARVDLWLETGAGFPVAASIAADAFLGPGHRLEIYGDDGSLVLENPTGDHLRGFTLKVASRQQAAFAPVETELEETGQDGRIVPVGRLARRFLDAIESGGGTSPNLQDGLRVQTLIDATRVADRLGAWQNVAPRT